MRIVVKYRKKRKDVQITIRLNKKFLGYIDFYAKNLDLNRNLFLERCADFAIANLDRFQAALIKLNMALEKFDLAETEEETISAFHKVNEAMKI